MGFILKISKASPYCIWGHVSFLRFTFIYVDVWLYVGAYLICICDIVCVYVGAGTTEAWRRYPITGAVVIGWDPSDLGSGNQNLVFWKSSKHSSPELSLQPRSMLPRGLCLYVIYSLLFYCSFWAIRFLTSSFPFYDAVVHTTVNFTECSSSLCHTEALQNAETDFHLS